jgi:hypothetical protein
VGATNNAIWLKEGKQCAGSKSGGYSTDICVSIIKQLFLSCTGKFIEWNVRRITDDELVKIRKKAA